LTVLATKFDLLGEMPVIQRKVGAMKANNRLERRFTKAKRFCSQLSRSAMPWKSPAWHTIY